MKNPLCKYPINVCYSISWKICLGPRRISFFGTILHGIVETHIDCANRLIQTIILRFLQKKNRNNSTITPDPKVHKEQSLTENIWELQIWSSPIYQLPQSKQTPFVNPQAVADTQKQAERTQTAIFKQNPKTKQEEGSPARWRRSPSNTKLEKIKGG